MKTAKEIRMTTEYSVAEYLASRQRLSMLLYNDLYYKIIGNIEPIELTEDILLKIGFKRGYNEIYSMALCIDYYDYYISYQNVKDNEYSFVGYGYKNNVKIKHAMLNDIKYLHQLQNAYYLLTGQELEVEL